MTLGYFMGIGPGELLVICVVVAIVTLVVRSRMEGPGRR
jgi:hypothetical protein